MKNKNAQIIPAAPGTRLVIVEDFKVVFHETVFGVLLDHYEDEHGNEDVAIEYVTRSGRMVIDHVPFLNDGHSACASGVVFPDGHIETYAGIFEGRDEMQAFIDDTRSYLLAEEE